MLLKMVSWNDYLFQSLTEDFSGVGVCPGKRLGCEGHGFFSMSTPNMEGNFFP
jgi:hypothetical protein